MTVTFVTITNRLSYNVKFQHYITYHLYNICVPIVIIDHQQKWYTVSSSRLMLELFRWWQVILTLMDHCPVEFRLGQFLQPIARSN